MRRQAPSSRPRKNRLRARRAGACSRRWAPSASSSSVSASTSAARSTPRRGALGLSSSVHIWWPGEGLESGLASPLAMATTMPRRSAPLALPAQAMQFPFGWAARPPRLFPPPPNAGSPPARSLVIWCGPSLSTSSCRPCQVRRAHRRKGAPRESVALGPAWLRRAGGKAVAIARDRAPRATNLAQSCRCCSRPRASMWKAGARLRSR